MNRRAWRAVVMVVFAWILWRQDFNSGDWVLLKGYQGINTCEAGVNSAINFLTEKGWKKVEKANSVPNTFVVEKTRNLKGRIWIYFCFPSDFEPRNRFRK